MAFCAIIHKFRPELINFDTLDPQDAFGNNELAFTTAEQHLGIPALLDPQDMVECEVLDRLSILTYLSQFYQTFHGATGPCKEATPTKLRYVTGSTCSSGSSTPSKSRPANVAMLPGKRSEPCKICSKPVFILERLHVSGRLLHRTCFKCARCHHQLSIANYYETESGSYCCDMCPDEEIEQTEVAEANKKIVESENAVDSDEAADEVNSLPESQRMSNNDIVEAVDQDDNITIVIINSNNVIIDSDDKLTEVFEVESTKVTESELENPEAPPEEEVTELLSGETISKLSIGCLQNSLLPVELLEENIEELSDEDEIFEIKRTLIPRPEQVEVEADQEKDKLLPAEEISDDQINDSVEEEKHSKHSNDIEEEEDMEDSPAPLPECDQHDEIIDNQKDEDTENSNANDKVVDKVDNENESPGCNATILESIQVSYPEDLNPDPVKNPFGSDNDKEEKEEEDVKDEVVEQQQKEELDIKKESTNPFGSDDDEEEEIGEVEPEKPEKAEPEMKKESSNPFGSDSDSDNVEEEVKQKPVSLQAPPPKPPRLSLNPFGSDFEDDDEGNEVVPEGSKKHQIVAPSRKKRHAPPPPTMTSSPIPTTRTSLLRSAPPRPPPLRPPPPLMTRSQKDEDNLSRRSQLLEESISVEAPASPPAPPPTRGLEAEVQTTSVSATTPASCVVTLLTPMSPNKANLEGQWKKKKGPAPARPTPPKRQVKKLPRKAVNMELLDIEVKQLELERQGVDLEKTIREVCEKSDKEREEAGLDNNDRDSLGPRAEDLIVQLFELVNEKNELFRRQTELMYMKREHRLEEEHADIEHQIRVLMAKPDALRTDEDKSLEDKLITRLMAIVSQRNEIVDCLEMDRLRELEEDESIEIHFSEYAAIKPLGEEEILKKKKRQEEERKEEKEKR